MSDSGLGDFGNDEQELDENALELLQAKAFHFDRLMPRFQECRRRELELEERVEGLRSEVSYLQEKLIAAEAPNVELHVEQVETIDARSVKESKRVRESSAPMSSRESDIEAASTNSVVPPPTDMGQAEEMKREADETVTSSRDEHASVINLREAVKKFRLPDNHNNVTRAEYDMVRSALLRMRKR